MSTIHKTNKNLVRYLRAGICAAILLAPSLLLAQVNLKIRVFDPVARRNVADAQVVFPDIRRKFETDENGIAEVSVPSTGFYTVRIITSALDSEGGYKVVRLNILSGGRTIDVPIRKAPPRRKTGPSRVTGSGGLKVTGFKEKTKLSRYQVRLDEVKRLPGLGGEALRGLETLPGINTPPFGGGDIIVRGANPNANFFLLDGLPLGYAFHFFGLNSVVHNDLIKTIDIYTGAYPANFGDATGGIVSIDTIDKVDKFGGHTTLSLWSANVLFKGPCADKQGYWIVSGRGSYMERTIGQFFPEGIRPPRYGDAQFKLHYRFNPKHAVTFYALGAKDTFGAEVQDRPSWDPTADPDPFLVGGRVALDRAFHTEAIRYEYRPASRITNTATIYVHDNIFFVDGSLGTTIEARQKITDGWAGLKNVLQWEVWEKHLFLDFGLEGRAFRYRNDGRTVRQINPDDPDPDPFDTVNPDFITVPVQDRNTEQFNNAYLMVTLRGGGFEFKPGVRAEYFGLTKQRVIDPRGTFSYTFQSNRLFSALPDDAATTFIAGAGIYHRVPDPNQYSPSSGNPELRMERGEHYGVGIEQVFGAWTVKVEGYRHYFTDTVVADAYITTAVRENRDPYERYRTPLLFNDRVGFSNDGTAFSEGFEIYVKRTKPPKVNGWYGWVSYTWSRTLQNNHQHKITDLERNTIYSADERRIVNQYDNTKDIFSDFDRRHIINVVFGYKISREWQVGLRWKYQSSAPYTPITGDDGGQVIANDRVIFDPTFSDLDNSGRLKDFHRLDLRLDRFIHYGWGFGNIFVELLNLYVRRNPETIDFSRGAPFSATNPETVYTFDTLSVPIPGSNKTARAPLFNIGLEMQF